MEQYEIRWTEYMQYRARLRGFDLSRLESVLLRSTERYFDTETGRSVVIGGYNDNLVMVPYEVDGTTITPITVHAITRQQINFRVNTGRFVYE